MVLRKGRGRKVLVMARCHHSRLMLKIRGCLLHSGRDKRRGANRTQHKYKVEQAKAWVFLVSGTVPVDAVWLSDGVLFL